MRAVHDESHRIASVVVESHPGPSHAPTSRAEVGLHSRTCTRFEVAAGTTGIQRVMLDDAVGSTPLTISVEAQLTWAVFPQFDSDSPAGIGDAWHQGGFAATGVAIDLIFDDGSRLCDQEVLDHHGVNADPESQGRSRTLRADQWTSKTVPLGAFVGRTVVGVELVLAAHGSPMKGWIDVVGFGPVDPHPSERRPCERVITTRGTHTGRGVSRGNTIPATALPNGFAFVIPVTNASDPDFPYTYHLDNDETNATGLEAFAISHSPTPWLGDRGVIHFFPVSSGSESVGRSSRRARFTHADEAARPHRYEVTFNDGTHARLVPTTDGAVAEFRFAGDRRAIVIDQPDDRGHVEIADDASSATLRGYSDYRSAMAEGAPRMYFAVSFDADVVSSERITIDDRDRVGALVKFDAPTVRMRISTSFVSQAQADAALQGPAPHDINAAEAVAAQLWDDLLGAVEVTGATADQLTTLTSCLYRLFLYPNVADEPVPDSDHPRHYGDIFGGQGSRQGELSVNNGFWDTYRTCWPLYLLLQPSRAARMLDGFVEHFRATGWMARWSAPGFVDCMVGTSSDAILADAVIKGAPLPDIERAYDSALRNATTPADRPAVGRAGIETSIFRGYTGREVHEGLSWTLEGAINDFAIAAFSAHLLDAWGANHPRFAELRANRAYFTSRSQTYRMLFDDKSGFFRGRTAGGDFLPAADFNPHVWGHDYTETNAWGMAFTAPHDGSGLAQLFGGRQALERRLDEYFALPETADPDHVGSYGFTIHEMTEARDVRMGQFALSNQPAHHVPFMYTFSTAPHKQTPIVREALRRQFLGSEIGQGYPGDEDNGEMSAWYIFGAMGLYCLGLGSGDYVIGAPLFEQMNVRLEGGRMLSIKTITEGAKGDHIQRVVVNGADWTSSFIPHSLVSAGCDILVHLGEEPVAWARDENTNESPTLLRDADLARASLAVVASSSTLDAPTLTDDSSIGTAEIQSGATLEWDAIAPFAAEMYTVTASAAPEEAPSAWCLEGFDGNNWVTLAQVIDETFRWPMQTRAFLIDAPAHYNRYRLTFTDIQPSSATQVELLCADEKYSAIRSTKEQ